MSTAGPRAPTAQETFGGTAAWSNPANALGAANDVYATVSPLASEGSETLVLSNFGFALPADSVIGGIAFTAQAKRTGGAVSLTAQLADGLAAKGAAKSAAVGTVEADLAFGGGGDLWGANLTPALVNSSAFGVHLTPTPPAANATVSLDSVAMTITYTASGTTQRPPVRTTLQIGLGMGVGGGSVASGGTGG